MSGFGRRRIGRNLNRRSRLLGRGARGRRRSSCLTDGPRGIGDRVGLSLLPDLFLFLLILRQNGNQVVRDGLLKLQWKVRQSDFTQHWSCDDTELTLNVWLNLTKSAVHLSRSALNTACFFWASLCFSPLTKSRKAGTTASPVDCTSKLSTGAQHSDGVLTIAGVGVAPLEVDT